MLIFHLLAHSDASLYSNIAEDSNALDIAVVHDGKVDELDPDVIPACLKKVKERLEIMKHFYQRWLSSHQYEKISVARVEKLLTK